MEKFWAICTCCVIKCKDEYLVLKRKNNDEEMAGVWEFPGGHAEFGEDLTNALTREIFEETGVKINTDSIKLVSVSQYEIKKECYTKCCVQLNYLFEVEEKPTIFISEEHSNYDWVKKNSAKLDEFLLDIIKHI